MNILDRLSEFQEDDGPMAIERLLQYRRESKALSRLIEKTSKESNYVTKIKLLTFCHEWLTETGYLMEDALDRLFKLGFKTKTKPRKMKRTEMAELFMNTFRVLQGRRKLPGVDHIIDLTYDNDGDGRWAELRSVLTSTQLDLDIWRLLLMVYGKPRIDELCHQNPSPPMRKKLGIK